MKTVQEMEDRIRGINVDTSETYIRKQTAVEWLVQQMNNNDFIFDEIDIQLFKQAKEMEKQQIFDAYVKRTSNCKSEKEAEQYYNETFKK